ncbi:hypothetical protein ACH5AL_03865 [Actinacidiphila glaucinigra]|uniref:hypothetical protein n=1 Tax=Actinacidiphila glaucinigra TaxID=235986 RepID=UPI003796FDF9
MKRPTPRLCEFCALAKQLPEAYSREHRNCRGVATVPLPNTKPGDPPLMATVCPCPCGEQRR